MDNENGKTRPNIIDDVVICKNKFTPSFWFS